MSGSRLLKAIMGAAAVHQGVRALGDALRSDTLGEAMPAEPPTRTQPTQYGATDVAAGDPVSAQKVAVHSIDERVSHIVAYIQKGREHPEIRKIAVQAVSQRCGEKWCTPPGNDRAEVNSVFNAVATTPAQHEKIVKAVFGEMKPRYRYVRDPVHADLFQHPIRTLEFGGGDCLPGTTLLLREGFELIALRDVTPDMRIWGLDQWSAVLNVWEKGSLPVDVVYLSNHRSFKATSDHKVYVRRCKEHDGICECPIETRETVRMHVADLAVGACLLSPEWTLRDYGGAAMQWFRSQNKPKPPVHVVDIARALVSLDVYDISTEDHYVYLPESDVTVSNCDDSCILMGSLVQSLGYPVRVRIIQTKGAPDWNHVYPVIGIPPEDPQKWIPMDLSMHHDKPPGWEAPQNMVVRVKDYEIPD